MRHSAAPLPLRAAGSPFFVVTVALVLLSLSFFGYGVLLHKAVKPPATAGAAHARPDAHTRHTHRSGGTAAKNSLSTVASSGLVGRGNDIGFQAMLAGGLGLLLSALTGLGVIRYLWATQSHTVEALLRAEHAAWDKQRSVLDTQRDALSAQLREAQQNKAEIEKLRQHASRQFQEFFRTLPVACFCFAADGKIVRWNAACEALYGIPASEAMDSTLWASVVPAEEREAMAGWISLVLAGESVLNAERRDHNAGGATFPVRCSMVPLYGADGEIIGGLSAGIDITEIQQYALQIAELGANLQETQAALQQTQAALQQTQAALDTQQAEAARLQTLRVDTADDGGPSDGEADTSAPPRDLVTGLCGHRAFQERLREETERAHRYNTPLSVIVFDLDGFGAYNHALGFEAGDLALKSVASLIESKVRTVDVAARYDADTYALILPETNEAGTRIAADRLRSGIAGLEWAQPLTACFGVALLTPDVSSPEALLTHALESLRGAKSLGPNTVVYHGDAPFPAIRKSRRKEPASQAA